MTYKDMVLNARHNGIADEQAMYKSIELVDDLLEKIKDAHGEMYEGFIRNTHEILYGHHYDECFAKEDVKWMWHTDINGEKRMGEHWTLEEILSVWQDKEFPSGTTDWDKYVAAHTGWHDFSRSFSEEQCLEIAYQFFFCDEDFPGDKVWQYTSLI